MELPQVFHRYRKEIASELASVVGNSSLAIYDMMRYHLGWIDSQGRPEEGTGGKLVRPTLCLLCCQAVGGEWRVALPAAAALELVHNFSLIHDDIEDGDEERRRRATVWWLWGQPQAINVGDAMHALARLAVLRLEERGIAAQTVIRAAHTLDQACVELCEGQFLDISYEGRFDIDVDAYVKMVDGKTAALMGCSLELGALVGTDDEALIGSFRRLGRKLGLVYQMTDDALGIWGGKSSASDIKKKKKTLPVIYALERARGEVREELVNIYMKSVLDAEDVARVIQILERLGAREYTQEMAERYYRGALAELEGARLSPQAREELRRVTDFLLEREY